METTLQRSLRSQRQQKYQDALRTLTLFKMAANTNIEKAIDLALFMEEVQKYDCLYNKFSKEYRDKYEKINCWKVIGEKFDLSPEHEFSVFPVASSSTSKSTHDYKKTRLSRSRQFTAAMLNLRNGANYVVRPRSPRSSFSDRSDHIETINRCDRWTIFVSDRSNYMETRLYLVTVG